MHVEVFAIGAAAAAAAAIGGGSGGNTGRGGGCHALGGGGGGSSDSGAPRMLLVGSWHTGVSVCTFVLVKHVNWSAKPVRRGCCLWALGTLVEGELVLRLLALQVHKYKH